MKVTVRGTAYGLWLFFWALTACFFLLTYPVNEPTPVAILYSLCIGFAGGKLAHWLFQWLFPV